jgi:tRNA (cmo5U34)-methyltransferase
MTSDYFDTAAATWDDNPARRAISMAVFEAIRQAVPLDRKMRVLDYGCGTGLLSFLLAGKVGSVLAVDTSDGMLEQVRMKVTQQGVKNVSVMQFDVTQDKKVVPANDLVASAMTMHHIAGTNVAIAGLAGMLKPGGWVAVADLCAEDGSFHADRSVPHNGFEPEQVAGWFRDAGLSEVTWRIVHDVDKNDRKYPVFCVFGKKTDD